jgi:hypothetical protein
LRLEVDELEAAELRVGEEAQKRIGSKSLTCKPVELDDNWRRDQHRLVACLQEPCASVVVLVCNIHRCIEGPGIANQRHERRLIRHVTGPASCIGSRLAGIAGADKTKPCRARVGLTLRKALDGPVLRKY